MPRKTRNGLAGCLLAVAGALMIWHACDKSSTYDEVQHIQSGYYYWTHFDFARGLEHPPLVRLAAALPLQFLHLTDPETLFPFLSQKPLSDRQEFLYGMLLVYRNPAAGADIILILSRLMIILATLALFWLCWHWSSALYGDIGGLLTLFLLCTLPPFLGHGSLATTDAGGAAGAVLSLYLLLRYLQNPGKKNLIWAGIGLGIAHVTKMSNLMFGPIAAAAVLIDPFKKQGSWKEKGAALAVLVMLCALIINFSHAFQEFLPPHEIHPRDLAAYGWPAPVRFIYRWLPLPDFYLMSAGFGSYHSKMGFPTFFLGRIHERGVWYYVPVLFWMKAPVASALAMLAVLFSLFRERLKMEEKIILSAAAIYSILLCRSGLNMGARHFLIIYVLLFVLAGRLAQGISWNKKQIALAAFAGAMQFIEVFSIAPNFLTHFNWAVGGPKRGIHYANEMDIGQDLKRLGRFMKRHPEAELVLSYFGTALPEYYGLALQELLPTGTQIHSQKINADNPDKELLAVSAAHLQGHMVGRETFAWLRSREPFAVMGNSIYIFDITKDAESHLRLAEIYRARGEAMKSERHFRRLKLI